MHSLLLKFYDGRPGDIVILTALVGLVIISSCSRLLCPAQDHHRGALLAFGL